MRTLKRIAILLLAVLAAGACGRSTSNEASTPTSATASPSEETSFAQLLDGKTWVITAAEGLQPDVNFAAGVETVAFDENGRVFAFDGCNGWNAEIDWTDSGFIHQDTGAVNSEDIACPVDAPASLSFGSLIFGYERVAVTFLQDNLISLENETIRLTADSTTTSAG